MSIQIEAKKVECAKLETIRSGLDQLPKERRFILR